MTTGDRGKPVEPIYRVDSSGNSSPTNQPRTDRWMGLGRSVVEEWKLGVSRIAFGNEPRGREGKSKTNTVNTELPDSRLLSVSIEVY